MPSKLRFHLQGDAPALPFQHASGLRALVLGWLGRLQPQLSADLHAANQPKPYTISPLWSDPQDLCHHWFEVSLLDDRLAPLLAEAASADPELRLGPQRFSLHSLPERRDAVAWDELLPHTVPPRPRFLIRLLTPTAHHAPGPHRKALLSPSPELYFRGWLGRWNLCATRWVCAPFALDESVLDAVASHVVIASFAGRTELVPHLDPRRPFVGFVGELTLELLQPHTLPLSQRASLLALTHLAPYCGTGIETMRGMGQTQVRVIERPERRP